VDFRSAVVKTLANTLGIRRAFALAEQQSPLSSIVYYHYITFRSFLQIYKNAKNYGKGQRNMV